MRIQDLGPHDAARVHRDERFMHRVTPLPRGDSSECSLPCVVEPKRENHSGCRPQSRGADLNQRESDALTDLAVYALNLDIEYHRLDERVRKLTQAGNWAADLWSVLRERAELAEELEEFRDAIAAFREQLRPQ